jgi:hypothetical protein
MNGPCDEDLANILARAAVLVAALLLPAYEQILAGVAAVSMIAVVVFGFVLRPRRENFCLRTTLVVTEPDHIVAIDHDQIAVRIELVRLWLLFIPTIIAIAFLIVTSANGFTWRFKLLDRLLDVPTYSSILIVRGFLVLVVGLLSTWVSEGWVLRDAEACSADAVSIRSGTVSYSFKDRFGGYYGGEGFTVDLFRSPKLARIVFYKPSKPQVNKIAMAFLFHRPVIIARGVTDLDDARVARRSLNVQSLQRPT